MRKKRGNAECHFESVNSIKKEEIFGLFSE